MRHVWNCAIACALVPCSAFAQQCAAPGPQCAAPQYYSAPPAPAPAPPTPAPPAPAPGNFLRGPATGQAAGESRSLGFRGPSIRVPAFTLSLPTIELPSLVKFRRNPEMHFDSATGAWTPAPVAEFANVPTPSPAPPAAPAPAAPAPAPIYVMPAPVGGCTADARSAEIESRLARIDQLEREVLAMREAYASRLAAFEGQQTRNTTSKPAAAAATKPLPPAPSEPTIGARHAKPTRYIQATYEEEQQNQNPTPLVLRRRPFSSIPPNEQEDGFGAWSRPSAPSP